MKKAAVNICDPGVCPDIRVQPLLVGSAISLVVVAFLASAGWKDAWEMTGPGRVEEAGDKNSGLRGPQPSLLIHSSLAFYWPRLPALYTAVLDLKSRSSLNVL